MIGSSSKVGETPSPVWRSRLSPDLPATDWRLGPIGFAYDDWQGWFYPPGWKRERRLEYLATQFQAVELDTTFYALPSVSTARSWASQVPDDFLFVVKAPAEVTHRPTSPGASLSLWKGFLERMELLGPARTYPFLQMPPSFGREGLGVVEELVESAGAWRERVILEVRHPSWSMEGPWPTGPAIAACDRAGVGEAGLLPREGEFIPWPPVDQAPFLYLRLNGRHGQYESDNREVYDPSRRLAWWIKEIAPLLQERRRVIAVAGNSYAGCAPATLDKLRRRLGLPSPPPLQDTLF